MTTRITRKEAEKKIHKSEYHNYTLLIHSNLIQLSKEFKNSEICNNHDAEEKHITRTPTAP